jgi:hypothetical protein
VSSTASIISGRKFTSDIGSFATFALLSSWIRECATEHDDCFKLPEAVLKQFLDARTQPILYTKEFIDVQEAFPISFRVVDVGPRDGSWEPYLLDTRRQYKISYYIALNHCWWNIIMPSNYNILLEKILQILRS